MHDYDTSTSHSSPMINYRKDAKKGVKFTFMVVGETGTGKTTFVNALLNKPVLTHRYEPRGASDTKTIAFTSSKSVALPNTAILTRHEFNAAQAHEEPGIALTETKVELVDDEGLKLLLNIIDTPGFGENLNNEMCFTEIENYLKQQFDLVLAEETRIKRNPRFVDTRVHVLLYFITPTGHGLREIDIQCMKRLSKYVNIIPIVGRADSFTEAELRHFKQQIRTDIERFNVPIFQFDNYLNDYDDVDSDLVAESKFLAGLQPFAVVSLELEYEVRDAKTGALRVIKGRQYPWGVLDINDPRYSDFPIVKSVLLGSHLQDLKDLTHDFLYETYRTERLSKVTGRSAHEGDFGDGQFHDAADESSFYANSTAQHETAMPSLLNLALLTGGADDTTQVHHHANDSVLSLQRLVVAEDDALAEMPLPKLRDSPLFEAEESHVNGSGHSNGGVPPRNLHPNNAAFKRLSIGPQRNQLRQLSETVPYVIRHERILERQQKLEEMEMASAKELASRAAMLEQKAAELKAKERALMRRLEEERLRKGSAFTTAESTTALSVRSEEYYDGEGEETEKTE